MRIYIVAKVCETSLSGLHLQGGGDGDDSPNANSYSAMPRLCLDCLTLNLEGFLQAVETFVLRLCVRPNA